MAPEKSNQLIRNIEKLKLIARDPEQFLINNYQRYKNLKGFRLELFIANKYNLLCTKIRWLKFTNLKLFELVHIQNKGEVDQTYSLTGRHPKKTFCPYCEKFVIPTRLYKLDAADIVIILFTGGLWAIFLLVMYLFIRRCPVCNYNLRGFKYISENKNN